MPTKIGDLQAEVQALEKRLAADTARLATLKEELLSVRVRDLLLRTKARLDAARLAATSDAERELAELVIEQDRDTVLREQAVSDLRELMAEQGRRTRRDPADTLVLEARALRKVASRLAKSLTWRQKRIDKLRV